MANFMKWIRVAVIMAALCLPHLVESRQQGNGNGGGSMSNERGGCDSMETGKRGGGGGGGGGGPNRRNGHRRKHHHRKNGNDISLWIDEQQLKMLSGLFLPQDYSHSRIYAIENGNVLTELRDGSNIYSYLTIPSEVKYVNFTWKSGGRKYFYNFDTLQTLDESILKAPTVSIKTQGRIPNEEKNFSVFLPCTGNSSGTAMFNIGLCIQNHKGKSLYGTPLRLNLKKECARRGPDPECSQKCGNNGVCHHNICQCKPGYTGEYCQTAFCFPQCLNGGNCTAPAVCTCPDGYQGTQCEGGICREKCRNGGKCVQKDKCQCSKGYYGLHCEYSKCVIPCKNGGRCIGTNLCRCPTGLRGNHCEIGRKQRSTCKRPCKHGICMPNRTCKCHKNFYGRYCNARSKKSRSNHR